MTNQKANLSQFVRLFWIFNIVVALIRVALAKSVGLGVDEAHYVLFSRFLDLSYFDHPPLIGWVQFLFQQLPFQGDWLARLPAIAFGFWGNWLIFRFLRRHKFSDEHSFWAVVALNATPLYNLTSLMFLPDSLLVPFVFLIIEAVERIEADPQTWLGWLYLGLSLGLSGLSKYTAAIYLPALGFYFFRSRSLRSSILSWQALSGVLVAGVVVSPVMIWNIQHSFSSFKYQGDHMFRWSEISVKRVLDSQVVQLAICGVVPYGLALYGLFSPKLKVHRLARYLSLAIGLFFVFVSLTQVLLPHWMLIFFTLMIPLSVASLLKQKRAKKWIVWGVSTSGLLTLFLSSELLFTFLPGPTTALLYQDIYQWDRVVAQGNRFLDQVPNPHKALAVTNWIFMSRTLYYNRDKAPVFNIEGRHDEYEIWNPVSPEGFDLIVITEKNHESDLLSQANCSGLKKVGELKSILKQTVIRDMVYYHCVKYMGHRKASG